MFQANVSDVIQYLVDLNLDRKTVEYDEDYTVVKRPGIHIRFIARVDDTSTGKNMYAYVHFLFFGNTSVFFFAGSEMFLNKIELNQFQNTSNHDSCWRSDGFSKLDELYFRMCNAVSKEKAPIDLYTDVSFLNFFKMQKVEVQYRNIDGRPKLIKVEVNQGEMK